MDKEHLIDLISNSIISEIKDLKLMRKSAKKLIGTIDFSTFRKSSCKAKSPIKTMKLVKIKSFKNFFSLLHKFIFNTRFY